MAGHPLRPASHRSLGEPLPHQLANDTRDHPKAPGYPGLFSQNMRIVSLFSISNPFGLLSQSLGQVSHALLTRAPVAHPRKDKPLDLHVLSTPPAFVLSQDQTLHPNSSLLYLFITYRPYSVVKHQGLKARLKNPLVSERRINLPDSAF